jgi:hypothetical protein
LADQDDWISVISLGILWRNDAFLHARNSYVQWKWSQICDCVPAPGTANPPVLAVSNNQICTQGLPANASTIVYVQKLPTDIVGLTLDTPGFVPPIPGQNPAQGPAGYGYTQSAVAVGDPTPNVALWVPPGPTTGWPLYIQPAPNVQGAPSHYPDFTQGLYFFWYIAIVQPYTQNYCMPFNLHYVYPKPPGTPVAPPAPTPLPPNIPPAPGCPTISGLQDLGNMLCDLDQRMNAVNAKLDMLAYKLNTPVVVQDPAPTAAPTGTPLPVPDTATGVVITCTTLPAHQDAWGNPPYYPRLGHVAMFTQYGPLLSVVLAHSPQVVMFPTPLVTSVQLDLAAGTVAQLQYLNA